MLISSALCLVLSTDKNLKKNQRTLVSSRFYYGSFKKTRQIEMGSATLEIASAEGSEKEKKKERGAFERADRHKALCLHFSFWSSSARPTQTSEQRHTKLCIYPTFTCSRRRDHISQYYK